MVAPRLDPPPLAMDQPIDPRVNAWLEIDLAAIRTNLTGLRRPLAPETEVMAIIKADAYGHGAPQVAKALLAAGATRFGVATVLEAEQLRQAGIIKPILVLGPLLPGQLETALMHDLEVMLSSDQAVQDLAAAAARLGLLAKAHVKVDTGMGRIGFQPADGVALLRRWDADGPIELVGVCTHFAAAEDQPDFTRLQLTCFRDVLTAAGPFDHPVLRHAANSAATLSLAESHFDCVRPGIVLYGAMAGEANQPVMRLVARLTLVKDAPVGSTLGYGRTYTVRAPMRVGVVPIGYDDGLPRALSNRQDVLVGGRRCPLVGVVSMDQCLVDLGDLDARPGDEVVLLGAQGDAAITAEEWAERCGTITYEILCRLGSSRLARFYRP